MRQDLELDAIIEDYLLGRLTAEEMAAFEQLRTSDASVDHRVVAHKAFLEAMGSYGQQKHLRDQMNHIHETIATEALVEQLSPHPSRVVQLFRKNKLAMAVAASFVLLTFVSIYSIQHNKQQAGSYQQMSVEIAKIKRSQNSLIRNINSSNLGQKPEANPGNFGGTGFAISSNGYIVTNLHVIKSAESVSVQNSKGLTFKAKTVYTDPQYDLAIIKIDDANFVQLPNLPYAIKRSTTLVGENVYTLGYPKDDAVLGEGYVSSRSGFNGDSLQYQVSIPVNPGNSGGPLLDNQGNLVGVISGKESLTDGAAFAIKSKYIMEALRAIPADSIGNKRVLVGTQRKNSLNGLKRPQQIEKLQDFVFMVKVY